jgi:hypothetical protein
MSYYRLSDALHVIRQLGHRGQECWCDVAIDNPIMRGRHSQLCLNIRDFVRACEEQEKTEAKPGWLKQV